MVAETFLIRLENYIRKSQFIWVICTPKSPQDLACVGSKYPTVSLQRNM